MKYWRAEQFLEELKSIKCRENAIVKCIVSQNKDLWQGND